MGDKALALGHYVPSGLVLYPPYVPIGHDVCNTMSYIHVTVSVKILCEMAP